MSIRIASTVPTIDALQTLPGPYSAGDIVIADGYYAAADGGGGIFCFDPATITSAVLLSATVADASNATPIQITTANLHPFVEGQSVVIAEVNGNTAANGPWLISEVTSTTFKLVGSQGNGQYSGGGTVSSVNVTASTPHRL